jgi:hypothetical protein
MFSQRGTQAVGIVLAVSDEPFHADSLANEQVSTLDVGGVARCQRKAERSSKGVDERMDLRRPAAARDANGLGTSPPLLRRQNTGAP